MKNLIQMIMNKKFIKIYLLLCAVGISFSIMENLLGVSFTPEKKEENVVTKSESEIKADLEFKEKCKEEVEKYGNMINDSYHYSRRGDWYTALSEATMKGYMHSVKYLLSQDIVDVNKMNPLITALEHDMVYQNSNTFKEVLNHPKVDSEHVSKAFVFACKNKDLNIIRELLNHPKTNPNIQEKGITPLMEACENGKVLVVKELLNHPKIDLTVKDENGKSVLWHLKKQYRYTKETPEQKEIAKILIESIVKKGGNINEKDKNGNPISRYYGREITKIFIDNGADY